MVHHHTKSEEDRLLRWLETIDDYVMIVCGIAGIAGMLYAFWILLKPMVLGTPF